eukprot:Skav209770  [mRNA]  locus=scaffold9:375456:377362:- [translate_table: standard]
MEHVVAMAAAEAAENPTASSAMREFGSIRPRDAEQRAHQVLQKYQLTAPIRIDRVDLADNKHYKAFPFIKFSTWVKFLLDSGRLSRQLCACVDLASMRVKLCEFWRRYENLYPNHQIFIMRDQYQLDMGLVIPVYSHTDEGRSQKKAPLWLLSTHGAVGRGTRAWLRKNKDKVALKRSGFGLNFCGHTMGTRFMFGCMLRKLYKKNPQSLDNYVLEYAKDMHHLLVEGVCSSDNSVRVRCCHLGTMGDLPALARMGNMKYTFSHATRIVFARGKNRFAVVPKLHMLHHGALNLLRESQRAEEDNTDWTINPLGESVQMEEDWIGRPSRLSRRVAPRLLHYRVCQRMLISAMDFLKKADLDQRGLFAAVDA